MDDVANGFTPQIEESLKLEFELHKHLTTLISGLLLAIVTVLEAFFFEKGSPPIDGIQRGALVFTFGLLGAAFLGSITSMYLITMRLRIADARPLPRTLTLGYSIGGLFGGLYAFVLFAYLRN